MCQYHTMSGVITLFISTVLIQKTFQTTLKQSDVDLKIMSFNVWGMPEIWGSTYKEERINGIAREISRGVFDVYLLQELWMEKDYYEIASSIPNGYFITGFRQLSASKSESESYCDGSYSPKGCSGLTIMSKYPFKEVQFDVFSERGNRTKIFIDGEVIVRKGVGRVKIEPFPNLIVDLFTTHLAADPNARFGYNNSYYREKQVNQLLEKEVFLSSSDLVVVGGDFNLFPMKNENSIYQTIRKEMNDSADGLDYRSKEDLSTYANPSNTFSDGNYSPMVLDYIFSRINHPRKIDAWTSSYNLPNYKTFLGNSTISLSDHEAITTTISIRVL